MRRRALVGILILPLLFILLSPVYSLAVDDVYSDEISESLDELERLLEGEFDFDDSDEAVDEGDDLLDEVEEIMRGDSDMYDDLDSEEDKELVEVEKIDIDRYVKMIQVKGGCFMMGDNFGSGHYDERPMHRVCVDDYDIADAEVTQELWEKVSGFNPSHYQNPDNPVEYVSWTDIKYFLIKLNETTDRHFRLPTEAEWEYAARGRGKLEEWPGTNDDEDLIEYAWFDFTSMEKPHPIKKKLPNLLGLYDMAGNVWEWVYDFYDMGYYKSSISDNPEGPDFSVWNVLRGGSFIDDSRKIRSSGRYGSVSTRRAANFGFRLAE